MIPIVTVSADENPEYSTNPGKATQDQVFLLSLKETKKYFASGEEIAAVCATEEFTEMTAFPGYGSVREIQGIFVIKLS